MKKKEFTLPTLLGLFIALGGLVAGIWLVRGQLRGSLQASPEESPQKVTVTNVGDTTATISWITDKAVSGYIKFGEQGRAINSSVSDQRDTRKGEGIVVPTTADDNGDFVLSGPEDLPPGPHHLTITSLINGVTSRITKTFTVYAVGESLIPAYSSTPSATLAITRTPSPTQRPTAGSPTPPTIRTATSTPT